MRYPFISDHTHQFGVEHMCLVLGVGLNIKPEAVPINGLGVGVSAIDTGMKLRVLGAALGRVEL